jgi:hypothetical protein
MPHDGLDFSQRAQLSELMDEPCSPEVIEACLRDLARVNRWFGAYRPLLRWLDEMRLRRAADRSASWTWHAAMATGCAGSNAGPATAG